MTAAAFSRPRRAVFAALLVVALLGAALPTSVGAAEEEEPKPCRLRPSDKDVTRLENLTAQRPRVLASQAELNRAGSLAQNDTRAQGWRVQLRDAADGMVGNAPTTYTKVGPRLQFGTYKNRMLVLSLAWRLVGDPRYAQQAEQEMLAAAGYPDWNPGHYLDVAEMTGATALGYDWFFEALPPESRDTIRKAIVAKGLRTSRCFYRDVRGPVTRTDNWGIVTNTGLAMGAVAVAETNPKLAAAVLGNALRRIKPAMNRFSEDGTYPEGLAYWRYTTEHAVKLLGTLEAGFGRQFGIATLGGFPRAGNHPLHALAPNRKVANFGDTREKLGAAPQLYWLAHRFGRPVDAWLARRMAKQSWSPLHLLWYAPETMTPGTADVPPSVMSSVGTAYLRGRWGRKLIGYAAVKGGSNAASHAHPELGSFLYDVKGKRWASDLGRDDYNLSGYFDPARRRQYYRLSTSGQNTLTLNGREQPRSAAAKVRHFAVEPQRSEVVLGLAKAYPGTRSVKRGVALIDRRRLLVQDEITADEQVSVLWAMHTRADVAISLDGLTATLTQGDRQVTAQILDSRGQPVGFTTASAEQDEPQARNRGVTRLQISTFTAAPVEGRPSRLRLVVLLSPGKGGGEPPPLVPLRDWAATPEPAPTA